MPDVNEQLADIRERIAVVETDISYIRKAVDEHNAIDATKKNGSIVIPVAAVVTALELVKVIAERLF